MSPAHYPSQLQESHLYWSQNAGPGQTPISTDVSLILERDDTLLHIAEVANQDVEMRDVFPANTLYLVIDTNILIHQPGVIKRLSKDIEDHSIPIVIVIPNIVLTELDGLKKRDDVKWFAQTASTFLLEKVRQWKSVRVQARKETLHIEGGDSEAIRKNDIKIFDCCSYFHTKGEVVLASGDKNLCIECEKEDIRTISPNPKRTWTSRDIAELIKRREINGVTIHLEQFHGHEDASYRPASDGSTRARVTEGSVWQADEDSMDVDEEYVMKDPEEEFVPSHALDAFHWQVIDQFSLVLKDLADRLRAGSGHGGPPVPSTHAPWYRRLAFQDWTVEHCMDYFNYCLQQKAQAKLRQISPPIPIFLLRSQQNLHGRRGRRGQDWSRQDWINAANGLKEIGERFQDGPLYMSVRALETEMGQVFLKPMRPTGT